MVPPPPPPPPPYNPHMMEANPRYQGKPEASTMMMCLNVVNTLTHFLLGAVACIAFSFATIFVPTSSIAQHIYLCTLGYVVLMSEAILTMNSHAGWSQMLMYPQKRTIHRIMQVLGATLAIAGSAVRMTDLTRNLTSAHGIMGFTAMLLTLLSLIGGLLNLVLSKKINGALLKTLHTCIGSLTITIAFICLCLGFSNYSRFLLGHAYANLCIIITVFALAGVLFSAFSKFIVKENRWP